MSLLHCPTINNPFDYIVIGFVMKVFAPMTGLFISCQIADAFFGILSWFFIIKGVVKIPEEMCLPFGKEYQLLFRFFLLLCIIMIIRGYLIDYPFQWISLSGMINFHLFMPTYIICYFMPLTTLIPLKYINFRLILNFAVFFSIVSFLLAFFFRDQILTASTLGAIGLEEESVDLVKGQDLAFFGVFSFMSLLYFYLPSKKWKICMFGLFVTFFLMVLGGRRGSTMLFSILILASFYFFTLSQPKLVKWSFRIILTISLIIIGYYLIHSSIMSFILERGMEDNRTAVEEAMLEQMTFLEKLFGQGLNGRYYYPLLLDDHLNGWRYGIETGFYNLVLKGGYLLAFVYIVLLAIPAFKGLFKAENLFCKAGGFYIIYSLFCLWPFGHLSFDLSFLFIWIMVTCCMDNEILHMTDDEIKQKFFYNLEETHEDNIDEVHSDRVS